MDDRAITLPSPARCDNLRPVHPLTDFHALMINFNCTIQEGIVPEELRPALASELARISTDVLGGNPVDVTVQWIEVPHGFGFRGGALSTTSAVRGEIPPGCEQETRVRLMQSIQDRWMEITGCTTDELVVSARDRRPS